MAIMVKFRLSLFIKQKAKRCLLYTVRKMERNSCLIVLYLMNCKESEPTTLKHKTTIFERHVIFHPFVNLETKKIKITLKIFFSP